MKRLIAVAVKGSWEGDWQRAQGNEVAVIAAPIGEGEEVWLEMESGNGDGNRKWTKVLLRSGAPFSLKSTGLIRYRLVKDGSRAVEALPTSVEMVLSNGLAPTRRRPADG